MQCSAKAANGQTVRWPPSRLNPACSASGHCPSRRLSPSVAGTWRRPRSWFAEARELLEVVDDPVTRGRINLNDGYTALVTGDVDHGRDCLGQAMAATDDFEVQANAMVAMGWLDLISGDAHGALGWSEKCLELAESRGDSAVRAIAMGSSRRGSLAAGPPAARRTVAPAGLSTFARSQ